MASVPTGDDVKDAGMSAVKVGGAASVGGAVGRGVLGPGFGTALGGVLAGAALDGADGDMAATLAVERGMNELFAGAASGGGGGDNGQVM